MDQIQRELGEDRSKKERACYRKFVVFIQQLYETEDLTVEEQLLSYNPTITRGFTQMALRPGWVVQLAVAHPVEISGVVPYVESSSVIHMIERVLPSGYLYPISRSYDLLTALYVPETLPYLELIKEIYYKPFHFRRWGYWRNNNLEVELETVLANSLELPADDLEQNLQRAQYPEEIFSARHQKQITIGGVRYRRIVVVQPALPMVALAYVKVYFRTLVPVALYYETVLLPNNERLCGKDFTFATNEHVISPYCRRVDLEACVDSPYCRRVDLEACVDFESEERLEEGLEEGLEAPLLAQELQGQFNPRSMIIKLS